VDLVRHKTPKPTPPGGAPGQRETDLP
jgi:hypothetical protein